MTSTRTFTKHTAFQPRARTDSNMVYLAEIAGVMVIAGFTAACFGVYSEFIFFDEDGFRLVPLLVGVLPALARLSRLTQPDFEILKGRIKEKGLKLVVADLPTTHMLISSTDTITSSILNLVNNMLIDLLATMARLDNDKRRERIKQGLERKGYKPSGKKADIIKHARIKELNAKGLTKEEIAKAVGCGVATVYRVLKHDTKTNL